MSDNFELMDKLIDKGIKELQSEKLISKDFTIDRIGREDIYTGICNMFISNNMDMDNVPTMIMSYLKGYDIGKRSTVETKETAERNSQYI